MKHIKILPASCASHFSISYCRIAKFALLIPALAFTVKADFVATVESTNPLAYWRLDSNNSPSVVNGYTTTYQNGATTTPPGGGAPLAGYPNNAAVSLNGNNANPQYVSTSLSGGRTISKNASGAS